MAVTFLTQTDPEVKTEFGQKDQTFSENYLRAYIVFISRKLLNGGGLLATWPFPPFDSAIIFNPPF